MPQTLQAKDIDLRYLIDNFGLQLVQDDPFFPEWQENLPEITDLDKQLLDKVKAGYLNLLNYPPLLEDAMRMAILDPLLFIGDFYLAPFYVKSEEPIEINLEDEETLIKGKINTLVLKDQFWVMVIESKRASFSIEAGLPQILTYMLVNPHSGQPNFGMITTGGSFIFIKLVKNATPQYATSNIFDLRNRGNELYSVLSILKKLSQSVMFDC
ncbi:restriction endonuclease subunit R [Geitlerinema calcuttense]|uniref:Restriction endonuclease subunit R n=1 Tax=Geitlerinema calcuttense NRMC-F 0142 TaxID=2922238 RepID=A0ABT7M0V3_9CYAN|nr:restriction endonuclease subunit R [Geitlerinema calcuttense]MDL5057255.1 restriction endonuclease subunit R [Geitlerinema calcuttense NRMC-F 0142]